MVKSLATLCKYLETALRLLSSALLSGKVIFQGLNNWQASTSFINVLHHMQSLRDELGLYDVDFYRCGITPEHFDKLTANPVPIKDTDKRSKRFVEQNGPTAYELEAFYPVELQRLVEESIIHFTDMEVLEEELEHESVDLEGIDQIRGEVINLVEGLQKKQHC